MQDSTFNFLVFALPKYTVCLSFITHKLFKNWTLFLPMIMDFRVKFSPQIWALINAPFWGFNLPSILGLEPGQRDISRHNLLIHFY